LLAEAVRYKNCITVTLNGLNQKVVMTAQGTAAYGMYPENILLPEVADSLNRAGFQKKDICMVLSPEHPVAAIMRNSRIGDAARNDTAIGTIGWVSAFGAVVIPTVGVFIRSQAFFQALMEQSTPSCAGGPKTLIGLGFSETEARRLESQLAKVGALVYIACPERAKTDAAIELLRQTGAQEAAELKKTQAFEAAA
jgi:hypothetical protein